MMALIIVKSQVNALAKEISRKRNFKINNVTSDFPEALDREVRKIIEKAMERANENGRKTLMARDI